MTEREKAERLARCLKHPERCSDGELAGLIEVANRLSAPERPDPDFVASLRAELLQSARSSDVDESRGRLKGADGSGGKLRRLRWPLPWMAAVIALLLVGSASFFNRSPMWMPGKWLPK
ncbi:MAG: hypothetical protein C0P67_014375 [Bacillota bacterium]|uniref:hypothetical protein n=1 Tax=Planifilum fulgidum TaxID=201973 RepID=UPI001FDFFAE5|nr:hypothetical protein [Planifilum fulgidum]